jgi:hypothetical protein
VQHSDEFGGVPKARGEYRPLTVKGPQGALDPAAQTYRFSSIASNTGVRSPGEELMTRNISAVAAC